MLTTEQVKRIAGCVWNSVPHGVFEECGDIIVKTNLGTFDFDPIDDDADAIMVFKALVDECKKRGYRIELDEEFYINEFSGNIGHAVFYASEFNNESICLSYLAVMESK